MTLDETRRNQLLGAAVAATAAAGFIAITADEPARLRPSMAGGHSDDEKP